MSTFISKIQDKNLSLLFQANFSKSGIPVVILYRYHYNNRSAKPIPGLEKQMADALLKIEHQLDKVK
jgi:hypothetical protein